MRLLYDIGLRLYQVMLILIAPFHSRARSFVRSRRDIFESLERDFKNREGSTIWIHVASLGEYEQAKPIIQQLKISYPSFQILITFFSPSGYQVVNGTADVDFVHYLPFDSHQNATRFLELVKPQLAIFIKYELWYHYLIQLQRCVIPTLLVAANFRKEQFYFRSYGYFFKAAFATFDHFFVQNEQSKQTLAAYGFSNVSVSGDTRFDRVLDVVANAHSDGKLFKLSKKSDKVTIVLGSIWPSDMACLDALIDAFRDKVRFIIAPHRIEDHFVSQFQHLNPTSYSSSSPSELEKSSLIVLDTMGMLSSVYGLADLAVVGGGSRGALHNILEPAAHGIPVLFQRHESNSKFNEVEGLLADGGGFDFESAEEIVSKVDELINDLALRQAIGRKSRKFVERNAGATKMVMSKIDTLI